MERESFERAIDELYGYFRYNKAPAFDTVSRWFEKIKYIPGPAMPWIIDQIEELETLPQNIPRLFKQQWFAYQKAHPEKTIHLENYCDECHGTGLLHFRKIENKYGLKNGQSMKITYVAVCGKCSNWKNHFGSKLITGGIIKETGGIIPPTLKLTRNEILENGWELLEPENKYAPKSSGELPEVKVKPIPKSKTGYDGPRPERELFQ